MLISQSRISFCFIGRMNMLNNSAKYLSQTINNPHLANFEQTCTKKTNK